MFNNINVDQLNLKQRLHILATHRKNLQNKNGVKVSDSKFRMTQKLVRPGQVKIKSQGLSPQLIQQDRNFNKKGKSNDNKKQFNLHINLNLKKSLTQRTQSQNQRNNHFIFNPDFQFRLAGQQSQNRNAGRTAALSNHSPQKIKIKTSGMIMQPIDIRQSKQKYSNQKSQNKTKYIIHSNRKYSLNDKQKIQDILQSQQSPHKIKYANYVNYQNNNQNKIASQKKTDKAINKVIMITDQNKTNLTQFEEQQIKKFHLYYKGKRRIENRAQFTDVQGNALIEKGDSIAYRYEVTQQLGKGAFGKVFRCKDHKKNQFVALKVIRAIPKLTKQAKIQIQILEKAIQKDSECRHNIVRIKGSFIFRSHTCIAYQLLAMNLYEYLKLNKFKTTPENTLVKMSIQILHSLSFLNQNKIVHCDIKPQNIMLKQAHKTGVRLIDLGSSCYEDQQYYTYIQSRYYRAPEVILGIRYTPAIDIWSFGCVLAEMYTGYPLFPGESEQQQLLMYIQLLGNPPPHMLEVGKRRKRFFNDNFQCRVPQSSRKYRLPKGLTFQKALQNCQNKLFVQFLKRCIQWDPSKRIQPKQALLHDWILSGIPVNIRARHIVQVTGQPVSF